MGWQSIVSCVLGLLLLGQPAAADVLALKTGVKHNGTIANREELRSRPSEAQAVGLLREDSGELLRFAVDDVDYVVLQEQDRQVVIDFSSLTRGRPQPAAVALLPQDSPSSGAAGYILGGLALGALGALVKFGGAKATITESSISADEKSYNGVNYALMGLGGVLVLVGLAKDSSTPPAAVGALQGCGLLIAAAGSEHSAALGVRVAF